MEGQPDGDRGVRIWVDADACPREVKRVLVRAAHRTQIPMILVSNHDPAMTTSALVQVRFVPPRADAADQEIARESRAGDLVITADVPLAAIVVGNGVQALDPRGREYTADDVQTRLSQRDFFEGLRSAGVKTSGPREYGDDDKQRFAAALDRILTRMLRSGPGQG